MEELIPITLFLGAFAMVFGIRYFSNKEKMAMIERGIDPGIRRPQQSAPKPFLSLKFGLLFVGLGLGVLLALFIVLQNNIIPEQAVAVYFGFISIFGGLGLIISYIIEKNWLDKQKEDI
jgi:tetrahydromethanopterin S-methyltransferase subunit E